MTPNHVAKPKIIGFITLLSIVLRSVCNPIALIAITIKNFPISANRFIVLLIIVRFGNRSNILLKILINTNPTINHGTDFLKSYFLLL